MNNGAFTRLGICTSAALAWCGLLGGFADAQTRTPPVPSPPFIMGIPATGHVCGTDTISVPPPGSEGGGSHAACGTLWASCRTATITVQNETVLRGDRAIQEELDADTWTVATHVDNCDAQLGWCEWQDNINIVTNGNTTQISTTLKNWRKGDWQSWRRIILWAICQ